MRARRGLRALVAGALSLAMTIGLATGALAIGGGSQDQGAPPASGGQPATPPASGGGGSGGVPTYDYWTFNSVAVAPGITQAGCAADNGSGGTYVGVRFRYRYPYGLGLTGVQNAIRQGESAMAALGIERLSTTCLYDGSYRQETLKCVLYSTAEVAMFAPRNKVLADQTAYSAFGRGDHSITACESSRTEAYVNADVSEYGRYRLDAYSRAVNMVVQRTVAANGLTGEWMPDRIVSISSEYTTNPYSAEAYLTCAGYTEGSPTRTYSYTEADCGPDGTTGRTTYTCSVPTKPVYFNGEYLAEDERTGRTRDHADIPRSGEVLLLRFETPTVSGEGLVSINGTSSRVIRETGSTPWTLPDGSLPAGPDAQLVYVSRPGVSGNMLTRDGSGTNWQAGAVAAWTVRAFWISDDDSATRLTGEYAYDGTWERSSVRIVGYIEGRWVTEPVTVRVNSRAICRTETLDLVISRMANS